jgi:hypothetical protein
MQHKAVNRNATLMSKNITQDSKKPAMTHTLSPLPHTWIFDMDGTIVKHNGYKDGGGEG